MVSHRLIEPSREADPSVTCGETTSINVADCTSPDEPTTSMLARAKGAGHGACHCGAHVETPAPTITCGLVATWTIDPSLGRKRVTIVSPKGAVNV